MNAFQNDCKYFGGVTLYVQVKEGVKVVQLEQLYSQFVQAKFLHSWLWFTRLSYEALNLYYHITSITCSSVMNL